MAQRNARRSSKRPPISERKRRELVRRSKDRGCLLMFGVALAAPFIACFPAYFNFAGWSWLVMAIGLTGFCGMLILNQRRLSRWLNAPPKQDGKGS
ncbi:MAG: hypothetical protein KDD44_00535 [Bdellovibrionales bacterium]|nr:hypothetical protein [Bdellovibrionales bacterium]